MDMDMEIDMDIDMEIDMDLWMITRMLFKEAEAELGGADSCSQPVTFYIGRARKFFAPDFVK